MMFQLLWHWQIEKQTIQTDRDTTRGNFHMPEDFFFFFWHCIKNQYGKTDSNNRIEW